MWSSSSRMAVALRHHIHVVSAKRVVDSPGLRAHGSPEVKGGKPTMLDQEP